MQIGSDRQCFHSCSRDMWPTFVYKPSRAKLGQSKSPQQKIRCNGRYIGTAIASPSGISSSQVFFYIGLTRDSRIAPVQTLDGSVAGASFGKSAHPVWRLPACVSSDLLRAYAYASRTVLLLALVAEATIHLSTGTDC